VVLGRGENIPRGQIRENDHSMTGQNIYISINFDDLAKSLKRRISVIPAKAGIKLAPLTLPLSPANGGEGGGEGEG